MRFLRRLLYLFYYLKESDFDLLKKFLRYSSAVSGRSKYGIVADVILSSLRYNISFKDYFCFRFYEFEGPAREEWAGTGFMYEYQLRMNPKESRGLLENKILFLDHYSDLIRRAYLPVSGNADDNRAVSALLHNSSGRLVLKGSLGQVGSEVEVINCEQFNPDSLLDYMRKRKFNLIEEFVIQHSEMNNLSPSGLNTVRIITQLHNNEVIIIGARLRITVNSSVDNMAAGNIAAPVDSETGVVSGPGVFSDITKEQVTRHPVTGKAIAGFQIPHWDKVLKLVDNAARRAGGNRSVGWDIAVTSDGPELIEGNHNWCKLLWQMPVNKGLKEELLKYN